LYAVDPLLVLDNLPTAVLVVDDAQRLVSANGAARLLLGAGDDPIGRAASELFPDWDAASRWQGEQDGGARHGALTVLRSDGAPLQVDVRTNTAVSAEGRLLTIVSVTGSLTPQAALDESSRGPSEGPASVDELSRQRLALATSEARARRLQDSGVIGVVLWTREGVLLDANDSFLGMVGYTREDLLRGRVRWREMTPSEFVELDERALREMDVHGFCQPFEKEYVHRDGHRVPILMGAAFWEGSRSEGVAWILDISERKRAEHQREQAVKALEDSRAQVQALIDHAPAAIFLKDHSGRYILVNDATARQLGLAPAEMLGRTDYDLLPHAVAEGFRGDDRRVLELNAPLELQQTLALGGVTRTVHTVKFPVRTPEGSVYATGGFSIDVTERKRLEDAYRHQSRVTTTITDNTTAALFLLNEHHHCTFMNPAAVKMTGYELHEVQGRSLHDVIHHTHADGTPYPSDGCPIQRAASNHRPEQGNDVFIRKDGSFFPVAFAASPILEHGTPIGTVIEVRDITREREASDALAMQAHVLRSMAEGVSVSDENGIIVYTNAAEDLMFGYAAGELIGQHVTVQNAYPPEENANIVREVIEQLQTKGVWSGEWKNVKKDGTPFVTRALITSIDRSGQRHFVCVQADITHEKREREAAAFLSRVGAALASSLEPRSTIDSVLQLVVPQWSDACAVYLRGAAGELELVAVADVQPARAELLRRIHAAYPPKPDDAHGPAAAVRSGSGEWLPDVGERTWSTRASDTRHAEMLRELGVSSAITAPLLVHSRPIGAVTFAMSASSRSFDELDFATAEELARRIAVAIDNANLFELTQRERRRAEEANRAKDDLLSMTSHELRTPLNAILGWVRMLRGGSLAEAKRERALEIIERNATIQAQLVEDILDVSRAMTGKLSIENQLVDVAQVAEAAVDSVRATADAKRVQLRAVVDVDAGTVRGDASRLQQVCWNLLANAIKFTPTAGAIQFRVRRAGANVEIVVLDTGEGIEPLFLPHVFQPFRQQDASITRTHGGLGLGLAIVKHLVESHGGSIEAHSAGVGRGAKFTVSIPVAAAQPTVSPTSPPQIAPGRSLNCPPQLEGISVLVADDDEDARELLRSVFLRCKAQVTVAASVAEALASFDRAAPDVLVSDIGMPGQSGYELIRRIRELPDDAGGRIPALALTAYASSADRARALMEGFTAHAGKPMEPSELLAMVAAILPRKTVT
jgi:PAS domain S-box-containing protein